MTKTSHVTKQEEITDSQLLASIASATAEISEQKKILKSAQAELLARRKPEIEKLLKAKPEPFGVVNIVVGNHTIKVERKKKVKWDSAILSSLWAEMIKDGVDPSSYIKVDYTVNETVYKSWSDDLKAEFMAARTVEAAADTIKIEDEE